ncbi:hypothetical protein ACFCYC_20525 [Streptomyces sp. NPDC056402]|uniref:hypothetical protein n=1 Tax=Streptomyces sp. NPDC056402 TaxID=3345810 RepID=UPI0035DB7212
MTQLAVVLLAIAIAIALVVVVAILAAAAAAGLARPDGAGYPSALTRAGAAFAATLMLAAALTTLFAS